MSIYYFIKMRFPIQEKRVELRAIFDREGNIPDLILHDDNYFHNFSLRLSGRLPNTKNKFHGLNYATLGDYKVQFELRPIRNVVVKQNTPKDDDSSMYEVFNRLNTGGINLRPQEIRTSMYHSAFYDMLYQINADSGWRRLLQTPEPDIHMKDIEILLRGFAMMIVGEEYAPSMVRFLNQFSRQCASHAPAQNAYLRDLFRSFLNACQDLPDDAFINKGNRRFNIALYEAVFTATCGAAFREQRLLDGAIAPNHITAIETDKTFLAAALQGTTQRTNVATSPHFSHKGALGI
jgi:hypothetical protein